MFVINQTPTITMPATNETSKHIHQGRNIKRFREMLGLKQEALAMQLGQDWNQKRVSLLESRETIEEDILGQVAAILKVPVEAIKNMDDDKAVNIIANTFNNESVAFAQYYKCSFNPIEKWVESLNDIKLIQEENKKLYERLLASEREKVELLKKGN